MNRKYVIILIYDLVCLPDNPDVGRLKLKQGKRDQSL